MSNDGRIIFCSGNNTYVRGENIASWNMHGRVVTLAELEALGIEFDKYPNAWLYDPETGQYL